MHFEALGPFSAAAVGVDPDLPWVMMLNGANCYGQDYTYLLSQLASRGYLAVVPTQLHPAPPKEDGKDWTKGACSSPVPVSLCTLALPLQTQSMFLDLSVPA